MYECIKTINVLIQAKHDYLNDLLDFKGYISLHSRLRHKIINQRE